MDPVKLVKRRTIPSSKSFVTFTLVGILSNQTSEVCVLFGGVCAFESNGVVEGREPSSTGMQSQKERFMASKSIQDWLQKSETDSEASHGNRKGPTKKASWRQQHRQSFPHKFSELFRISLQKKHYGMVLPSTILLSCKR